MNSSLSMNEMPNCFNDAQYADDDIAVKSNMLMLTEWDSGVWYEFLLL